MHLSLLSAKGVSIKAVKAQNLMGEGIHDHNTIENPEAVTPQSSKISIDNVKSGKITLSAHSVTTLEIELGT